MISLQVLLSIATNGRVLALYIGVTKPPQYVASFIHSVGYTGITYSRHGDETAMQDQFVAMQQFALTVCQILQSF